AVWSWNTCVALVCGNTVVWKPSELTPLTALGCHALLMRAVADVGAPSNVHRVVLGGREVGDGLVEDHRVALLSATGSTDMGRTVAPKAAGRMGRYLSESGGTNAAVAAPSAALALVVRGRACAAAAPAGQPCPTLRRLTGGGGAPRRPPVGWGVICWSWVVTTRLWPPLRRIWIWWCGAVCLRRPVLPGNGVPRCVA